MEKLELIKDYCKLLKLYYLNNDANQIIENAENKDLSYQDFLISILKNEIDLNEKKSQKKLLKNAGFPMLKRLEDFDFNFKKSITSKQVNRLVDLERIDRMFNLISLGSPGVGKTHLAIAMGLKAVEVDIR